MSAGSGHLCFDDYAHLYDRTRGGERRGRRFAEHLARYLDPAERVCEVGIGTGVVALGLSDLGFGVVGFDLSPRMLTGAARRLGDRVVVGDASQMPLRTDSVQQAYSVWVLHLVADPGDVLAEAARVLAPGGRYVVMGGRGAPPEQTDPIWDIVDEMHGRIAPWLTERTERDDPDRLEAKAARVGLRLVERGLGPADTFEDSPADEARSLEERAFSFFEYLPEEAYTEHVLPAIAALRALPDPDATIVRCAPRNHLLVFERGA